MTNLSDPWWVPFKRVSSYTFGKNIGTIDRFRDDHIPCDSDNDHYTDEFLSFNPAGNKDVLISTFDECIYSVTFWKEFYIGGDNFIGTPRVIFVEKLNSTFNNVDCVRSSDAIEFDDGDIYSEYYVGSLGLEFTVNIDDVIVYISAGDE